MILVSPCLALIEVTVLDILQVSKMFYTMLYSAHVQGGNEYGIGMMPEGESENQMHLNLKVRLVLAILYDGKTLGILFLANNVKDTVWKMATPAMLFCYAMVLS